MNLRQPLGGLAQRFDTRAMHPPVPAADEAARLRAHAATATALAAWCHAGTGNLGPGTQRAPDRRLLAGQLCRAAADGGAAARAFAQAFAREIDGSLRLEARAPGAARLAFRLAVKARDAMAWRARRPTDPWDAGWLLDTPLALQHLGMAWQPRRATLLLADARAQASLQPVLAALAPRCGGFHHPVRWLWVGGDGSGGDSLWPDRLPAHRFGLD